MEILGLEFDYEVEFYDTKSIFFRPWTTTIKHFYLTMFVNRFPKFTFNNSLKINKLIFALIFPLLVPRLLVYLLLNGGDKEHHLFFRMTKK